MEIGDTVVCTQPPLGRNGRIFPGKKLIGLVVGFGSHRMGCPMVEVLLEDGRNTVILRPQVEVINEDR